MLPVASLTQIPDPQKASLLLNQVLPENFFEIISRIGSNNFYDLVHIRMTCKKLCQVMDDKGLLANIFRLTFPTWPGPAPVDFKDAYSIVCRSISNVKKGVYGTSSFVTEDSVGRVCSLLVFNGKLITGSLDQAIRIFDLKTGDCEHALTEHPGPVSTLAVVEEQLFSVYEDQTIKTWDLKTGKCVGTLYGEGENCQARTIFETKLFSGFVDGRIEVRDVKTGKLLMMLEGHEAEVCILSTYQGKLFSGDREGAIKIWDLESGQCLATTKLSHLGAVETFAFLGTTFFTSFESNAGIFRWDISTGRCLGTLYQGYVKSLAVMGDNLISYSGFDSNDNVIKIWDPETKVCLTTLWPYTNFLNSVTAFDEKLFLCTDDGPVILWDYLVEDCVVLREISAMLTNCIFDSESEENSLDEFDDQTAEAKDRFFRLPEKLQKEIFFPEPIADIYSENGAALLAQSIKKYLREKNAPTENDQLVDTWLDVEGPSKRQKIDGS